MRDRIVSIRTLELRPSRLRSARLLFILALPWVTLLAQTGSAEFRPNPTPSVAIIYDGPDRPLAEGFLDARQIQNLLGHFGLTGDIIRLDNYKPDLLAGYRAAFFVGTTSGTRLPPALLDEVRRFQKPFCWIGRHIGMLLDTLEVQRQFGFHYLDYRDDLEFRQVQYKGVTLPKEDPDLNLVSVSDPAQVEVLATAHSTQSGSKPYALRHNRSGISRIPLSGRPVVSCQRGGSCCRSRVT